MFFYQRKEQKHEHTGESQESMGANKVRTDQGYFYGDMCIK